jgi:gamma-glutamylcyclotransferase (GGCT)/AIG2-like uncharacterized protein YtfP
MIAQPMARTPKRAVVFAYGSNLSREQMCARCPGARVLGRAELPKHTLAFGGHSARWGGAVATVVRSDAGSVPGLLYELPPEDLDRLDGFEGCPTAYERVARLVVDRDGKRRRAQVYVKPVSPRDLGPPAPAYLAVVQRAYARLGFDLSRLWRAAGRRR